MVIMLCPQCGRQHENPKGHCPFCTPKGRLTSRNKERPSEIEGPYTFVCEACGLEVEITYENSGFGMHANFNHSCAKKVRG